MKSGLCLSQCGQILGLARLFLLLVLVKLGGARLGTAPLSAVELAVSSADLLVMPVWLMGGWPTYRLLYCVR
ncbi:MAG: hypothetical protein KDE34_06280 [Anaerolineales bacterium]|nr:hypothetical protein [Anaerolineales bacterium]